MTANIAHRFPGRRSFIAGSILLILFGAIHGTAGLIESFNPPSDAAYLEVAAAMRKFVIKAWPNGISMWGATQLLSNSYTVLLVFAGITGLLVVRPMAMVGRLRAITVLNIMLCISLVGVTVVWMFLPPLLFSCLALAAYSASLVRQASAGPAH